VVHNDDTGMRVLKLKRDLAEKRTRVFTSGIVSVGEGRRSRYTLRAAVMLARTSPRC